MDLLESSDEIVSNAFVYKWTFLPTLDWYVGVHKGTEDDGYICSSSIVKDMIEWCPELWERTIVDVGSYDMMYELESAILQTSDAKRDIRSFNQHNNNGRFHRVGISPPNKGKPSPTKGVARSEKDRKAISEGRIKSPKTKGTTPWNKGIPHTDEVKKKCGRRPEGWKPWNAGKIGIPSGKKGKKYPGSRTKNTHLDIKPNIKEI